MYTESRKPVVSTAETEAPHLNVTLPPANLHVLIPASRPDVNLCKALISAGILNYPSPVIINWNQSFDDPGLVEGGSHLAKISGVHEYVANLDGSHDEDLVLMVDGYDLWFQLRPQTLVDRYFDINRRADKRISSELGLDAATKGIRQEIIFGCQVSNLIALLNTRSANESDRNAVGPGQLKTHLVMRSRIPACQKTSTARELILSATMRTHRMLTIVSAS